ncbi:uncharacterized protein LOC142222673 [Haematobia irritans]|uniref:uncharacterized protein LOC142222673 n=1 Tax=Haematobia irritans TaxID=7368 RepID=UPI003F5087AB
MAAVRDSVAEEPSTSTRRRAQQLHLSRSSLMNIMHKDLHLHAYKVQLSQELKPLDHSKHREWAEWFQEMATVDDQFSKKIIFSDEAHFHLSGFVNKQNCRIWANENPRVIVEKPMHPHALWSNKFNDRVISRNGDVNWPPRSCDLTPLNFFLWGYLKEKVYVDTPATIQELKDEIIRPINGIEPPLCLSVIENLDHRMEVCHRGRGAHLADILCHT